MSSPLNLSPGYTNYVPSSPEEWWTGFQKSTPEANEETPPPAAAGIDPLQNISESAAKEETPPPVATDVVMLESSSEETDTPRKRGPISKVIGPERAKYLKRCEKNNVKPDKNVVERKRRLDIKNRLSNLAEENIKLKERIETLQTKKKALKARVRQCDEEKTTDEALWRKMCHLERMVEDIRPAESRDLQRLMLKNESLRHRLNKRKEFLKEMLALMNELAAERNELQSRLSVPNATGS